MLRSQQLSIETDKINTELTALRAAFRKGDVEMRAEDGTDTEAYRAWQGKVDDAEKRLGETVARRHEAMESEDREVEARRAAGDVGGWNPEQREFIKLETRASMGEYLERNLSQGGRLTGETAEYDAALREAGVVTYDNIIPWGRFLEPERLKEVRAIGTPSSVQAMQDPIVRAVFAASTAAFLGTRYSSAGIGDALVPVLTPAVAAIDAKDDSIAAGGSIAVTTLTPKRFNVRYEIAVQDMHRVRGLESTVRADMLPAVMAELDKATINGASSGSVTGGILASLTVQTDPTSTNTWTTGLARFMLAIDGQYARTAKQLKIVTNAPLMRFLYGLVAGNTAVPLADYLMMQTGGLMCTSNMPASRGSTLDDAIICKSGPGMMYNGAGKVWGGGMQVIRDEKSASAKNEVAITGSAFYDYAVVRTAGFVQTSIKRA